MSALFSDTQWHLWLPLGAAALVMLALVLRRMETRRRVRLERVVDARLLPRLLPGYDAGVRRPLFWLTLIGFAALILAITQPRWGQAWVEVEKHSRDVLVLLDTSESMNAADLRPSRLVRARQKIQSLLERCSGDRFGLIAFAGGAALQCPLTLDHAYFRGVLDAVDTNTLSAKGTDIAAALREAAEVFREDAGRTGDAGKGSRAILVVSDGEHVSGDVLKVAEEAAAYAEILVLAVGTEEGAIVPPPVTQGRERVAPEFLQPHHARLDGETLRTVARDYNAYVALSASNDDVDRLQRELERLSGRAQASALRNRLINRYQWPLSVAIVCFVAEGLWLGVMPYVRVWRLRRAGGVMELGRYA
ncbi:MAG TPA: VWA domain-containing protein [Candidatus Hydrogenedentes bacterium]|nr:VWA domain-containing protein [Candidatus Hydrogenedentota bacterium]